MTSELGLVQDLRASLHRTYSQVTSLRRQVGALRSEMQQAADNVTRSQRMHTNLAAVMDILKASSAHLPSPAPGLPSHSAR